MFKIRVIDSSSKGNCIVASNDNFCVVLDAGLPLKRVSGYILSEKKDNNFLFVSHDHQDHVKFEYDYNVKLGLKSIEKKDAFVYYEHKDYGYLTFDLVHDVDNRGLMFIDKMSKEGFVYIIDTGSIPENVLKLSCVKEIDTIIIESNHDLDMLRANDKLPDSVKERIYSNHLSNFDCIKFLGAFCKSYTKQVVITHLSEHNNKPDLIEELLKSFRSGVGTDIAITITNEYKEN